MAFKMTDGTRLELPNNKKAAARYVADMVTNRGSLPDSEEKVTWDEFVNVISPKYRDAISSSEISPLLQQSMEILIREPVEPRMIITPLFTRVQAKGLNTQILAGAMGAVYAADVQESGTYPEVNFQMGGAVSTAFIGKSGIAASFTDEALRYSTFDIMAKNLELMGNAMVRHKEQKAVAFLKQLGTSLFDNLQPANSLYGVCSGRGVSGAPPTLKANGSMTMENLMRGMAHMAEEGFTPDTLLMHPLFYYTFLQDPVLKTMMLAHGGGSIFNMYSGDPGSQDPWSNGALGSRGPSRGTRIVNPRGTGTSGVGTGGAATSVEGRSQNTTSAPNLPSYFPFGFQILVSPLCPYDPESETGDIFLLSTGNVGFHLVDEEATTVEWRDEGTETVKVKIRERYGFAVCHEGQGVGVFKNVKRVANEYDGAVNAQVADLLDIEESDVKANL
tara:strand:- start:20 stop:1357 length:1338 start_codon:yes stop_codon:yes gene_type:complete